ncbi:MAG: hypothetical protein IKS00_06585 [Bacteroidales bacterium]|nr:hypothetical protein [Bacteroidales bacterium]
MENKNKNMETKQLKLTKNNCQNAIRDVENAVFSYKNSFPNSVSECVRNSAKFYLWLMALGSIALLIVQPNMTYGFITFMCVIGAVGVGQDLPYKHVYFFDYSNVLLKLKELKPYAEFPDIKRYIDSIEPNLQRAKKRKIMFKKLGTAVNILSLVVVVGYLAYVLIYESKYFRGKVENVHPGDGIGVFGELPSYFNMKPDKPFVTIKPLEGSGLTDNLDLYVENLGASRNFSDYHMYLCYALPKCSSQHKYVITDKQGNPSSIECFVCDSHGKYSAYVGVDEANVINTLNYVYTHTDELRYALCDGRSNNQDNEVTEQPQDSYSDKERQRESGFSNDKRDDLNSKAERHSNKD